MAKKILLVEDDALVVKPLYDKLTTNGFEVMIAENGRAGLESAVKNHPDLILLDLIMPVMDGITMLKCLREDAWGKDAKVIVLTVLSDADKVSEALKSGAYDFLVKTDWKLEDVVQKVKERLN